MVIFGLVYMIGLTWFTHIKPFKSEEWITQTTRLIDSIDFPSLWVENLSRSMLLELVDRYVAACRGCRGLAKGWRIVWGWLM